MKKHKLIFAHFSIKIIRSKFKLLVERATVSKDILIISETKLEESFPVENFYYLVSYPNPIQAELQSYFMFGKISIKTLGYRKVIDKGFLC